MAELVFKGKEFVYNHHLSVPFRPLIPHEEKGIGPVALDGNLIIHGDNLHALKALLPMYAGKVDCIFIDPPYNTGNEGWSYNDNVNSPMIREWLSTNPVGIEDGLRHDKWCAMMWPRLRLLHELLADTGSLWMTLDQNEVTRGWQLLSEIFGQQNAISLVSNVSNPKGRSDKQYIASANEYLLVFRKSESFTMGGFAPGSHIIRRYNKVENGTRYRLLDLRKTGDNDRREDRPELFYPFYFSHSAKKLTLVKTDCIDEDIIEILPKRDDGSDGRWRWSSATAEDRLERLIPAKMSRRDDWTVYEKDEFDERDLIKPTSNWNFQDVNSERGTERFEDLGFAEQQFNRPKPVGLVRRILELATKENSIILDSFAGSGTTAEAVMELNNLDGGNRKFILVECEAYANEVTAERVRRVVNGSPVGSKRKEILLEKTLSIRDLKGGAALFDEVSATKEFYSESFDEIRTELKDGVLRLIGERKIVANSEGLGGTFTYCTLGDPVELDRVLSGDTLPDFQALGGALFHMATSRAFDPGASREENFYLGATEGQHVWLIYRPDLDWLKSPDAALTLARAKDFAATDPDKKHLVFAPARYVSQKMLVEQGIPVEFVPLPFALYRIDRS